MRPFELALVLSLLLTALSGFVPLQRRPRWIRYLPWLSGALLALHLVLEGYRWQLAPAYALTAIQLLMSRRAQPAQAPPPARLRTILRIAAGVLVLLVLGTTTLLATLIPVFDLPAPSGALRIGTTTFSLVDSSRPEVFTGDTTDRRELLIQAWYPAEPAADARPEQLVPPRVARAMTQGLGLSRLPFLLSHLSLVKTHSYRDAPISETRPAYPVLVFSHGYWGTPTQNTVQMEELASHGYVLFSIGHSHESAALLHPDGRLVGLSHELFRSVQELGRKPGYGALLWRLIASPDPEERQRLLQENSERDVHFSTSVRLWAADTSFVLDELQRPDPAPALRRFQRRLDMERIGVFGMSFGGATAAAVCLQDSRCRAGINMDGTMFGAVAARDSALHVPFMFMTSEPFGMLPEPVFRRTRAPAWLLKVNGSTHLDFTDLSLVSPLLRTAGMMGPIDGERMQTIMNAYIVAFFDRTLADRDPPLLQGASTDYPEVELQIRTGASD